MAIVHVYCSYHELEGTCTLEDYNDAMSGANPSGMLKVEFPTFTQAVPFHTIVPRPPHPEADYYETGTQSHEIGQATQEMLDPHIYDYESISRYPNDRDRDFYPDDMPSSQIP